MNHLKFFFFAFLLTSLSSNLSAKEAIPSFQDEVLSKIKIEHKIGALVEGDISFKNTRGESVKFQDFYGNRPIVLVPVYFKCPMLCNLVLKAVVKTFKLMSFTAAKEFEVVVFSINPKETLELAQKKKALFIEEYSGADEEHVHFLTGDQENIDRLTDTIGFRYTYDPISGEYAHGASVIVLTPQGKVASYFGGIDYKPRDFRFALIEASGGKIGGIVDKILLMCYHYDPTTGKYGLVITRGLRVFGTATMVLLFGFIFFSLKKDKNNMRMKV